jgi:hypothetical protein
MEDKPGRTIELWLLALGLLFVSLSGWLRLQFVVNAWDFLIQTGIYPGPLYHAIGGGVWGLAGLVSAGGLLLRQRWAPAVTQASVVLVSGWYWLDYLLFTRSPDTRDNWPYMLVLTVVCLLLTFIILALNRQRRFFNLK